MIETHLTDRQHGMVSLAQLRELGVSWSTVVAQTKAGRWRHHLPRVYATFTGPPPRASRISAALLYGGAGAVLSHRTAAEEWGLVRCEDGPVHVTLPYGSSAVSQPGLVVVHRSRAFRHIVVASDPPRTSPGDTAIDLAVAEPDEVEARRMLVALLTTGRVGPDHLRRRLLERPPLRYRRALAEAVSLVRDGVQSALEELYASDVEAAHGLPVGRRQTPMSVDGFTLYEDVTYDHAGAEVTIRLDGRTHLADSTAFRDRRRDNAAELAGRARLVYGWKDLSNDPCAAAREVATVLVRRGWPGPPTRCERCA
ncbi:hypothetical protein PSU4_05930 [Pseudonocardia sulfidoxydans NBRC 16205]|uniref:DUF559 domain-containing protein n=1 Tax=Pseudonocardia sulfidoxydans NBRC 16205 TaxID=1223511 RepID=A0A511D9Z8_9PSEU|nr:hypothetical protein [Pseudonocardia sulfidoxydans]GEL21639.1 hypothetical protein PSU4_05930 [Pseudonocardia sulfidoxydans NBRC 16205]